MADCQLPPASQDDADRSDKHESEQAGRVDEGGCEAPHLPSLHVRAGDAHHERVDVRAAEVRACVAVRFRSRQATATRRSSRQARRRRRAPGRRQTGRNSCPPSRPEDRQSANRHARAQTELQKTPADPPPERSAQADGRRFLQLSLRSRMPVG